jgi:hypothetical protein
MKKNFTFGILIVSALFICFGGLIYAQATGTLYGTTGNSSNELIIIDPSTGVGVLVAPIVGASSGVTEIEFRDDEVLFGSTGGGTAEIITIDPLTGIATLVGTHPFGAVNGLDFDSGGNLLGSFYNPGVSTDLVIVDQATGGFSSVIGIIFPSDDVVTGLTFNSGGTLYGIARIPGANPPSFLYTIDPTTAIPTLVGPIGFDKVGAIEFGPGGILYGGVGTGVANAGALISIDPSTGAGTLIGSTGFLGISGLSFFPGIVPVELTSFTANANDNGNVELNWSTATEINNQMFEIERRKTEGQFTTIGYVEGYGTTTEPQEYSYIDNAVETGTYFYRLKQIDFLGTYEYSDEIEVEVIAPSEFTLEQNYPNPFNPSTQITYQLAQNSNVVLKVYNLLGKEVAVLVDEHKEAGIHKVNFDASSLPSGVYLYKIETAGLIKTKKMMLMK